MARPYPTAAAFKAALESHLRKRSEVLGVPLSTLQLKFVIERLIARLFREENPPWLLKGGFAMDLRFRPRARTTKDIDLSVALVAGEASPVSAEMRERLQAAVDHDFSDYLTFRIGTPKKELTNAPKGGGRFPCEAVLLGKTYAKFHIDVGVGDAVIGTPERLTGDNLAAFVGIGPATALAIPISQQFAEKIHAYTFPWSGRVNTRTKDLVDLVLLIERGSLEEGRIREALATTFSTRATHKLPAALPTPPESWKGEFAGMASESSLSTTDYLAAFRLLDEFWTRNDLGSAAP